MTVRITLSVKGIDIVRKGMERLRAAIPKVARSRLRDFAERVIARMKRYPPKLPNQKYVRTYRLQRSWKVVPLPNGYTMMSDAHQRGRYYTKWVVGNARGEMQAGIHSGRWPKFRDVVLAYARDLPKSIIEGLRVSGRRIES